MSCPKLELAGLRRAVGTEVVHWLGANKPAYKLDPGFLEHPRLSPRAVIGPGARFLEIAVPPGVCGMA